MDQIVAKWKITHLPELLESEWYNVVHMEDESFDSWDSRMVTLAANALQNY